MRRTGLALAVGTVSVAVFSGAADAKSHFRYVGKIENLQADARYVAWDRDARTTHVVDTRNGRSFDVPDPAGCEVRRGNSGPYEGGLVDVGGGYLMWRCVDPNSGQEVPGLMRIGEGRVVYAAGVQQLHEAYRTDAASVNFTAVGRHWIQWYASYNHYSKDVFLNWRTGDRQEDRDSDGSVPNLDDPQLVQRLCPPLARRANPDYDEFTAPFKPFDYEEPYGVTEAGGKSKVLLLERCGRDHHALVSRCDRGGCTSLDLFARVATWAEGHDVYAYSIRSRRRRRLGRINLHLIAPLVVFHTRTRVYAHDPVSSRTYVARLPRAG
jgi:hypothetical protein